MRVGLISVHSCPWRPLGIGDVGGMNLYLQKLSREMGRLGVAVDIFARRHDPAEPEIMQIYDKVRLIHLAAGAPADIPKINVYHHLYEFQTNLLTFLQREGANYTILHSHYWTSSLVGEKIKKQLGIPHVVTFHTLGEVKNRALMTEAEPALRIQSEKEIVANADSIIASTTEEKHNLVRLYGCQPDKIRVISAGVDLDFFRPMDKQTARRKLHLEGYGRVLLFAGRIEPIKGLDLLLQAMTHLPNGRTTRLLVVGGNAGKADEVARLSSLVDNLGINNKVDFVGAVAHEEMPLFYNAADICVIPSHHESFGLVAVEALASGTPVVASRVGGLASIVRDGETGYLVEERSPEALAMYLCLLMSEDNIRESMAKAARPSVLKFDWSSTARRVLSVYRELIEV